MIAFCKMSMGFIVIICAPESSIKCTPSNQYSKEGIDEVMLLKVSVWPFDDAHLLFYFTAYTPQNPENFNGDENDLMDALSGLRPFGTKIQQFQICTRLYDMFCIIRMTYL